MLNLYKKITILLIASLLIFPACKDKGGDFNAPPSPPPIADTTAPNPLSVFINGGASSTDTIDVTLDLLATDNVAVTAYFAAFNEATPPLASWSKWNIINPAQNYNGTVSFTLQGAVIEGANQREACVWFKDAADNISTHVCDTIDLMIADITAPANPTILIKGGASTTWRTQTFLDIAATDSIAVTAYYASEIDVTPVASDPAWIAVYTPAANYAAAVSFTLTGADLPGTYPRTVYIWFKDAAGNISPRANDSIDLIVRDTTKPTNTTILINADALESTTTAVNLILSAADNVGVTAYFVSESATTPFVLDPAWVIITPTLNYNGTVPFTITGSIIAGTHLRTVYAWFKDATGNVSSAVSDSINYIVTDTISPTATSLLLNQGALTTVSTNMFVQLEANDNLSLLAYFLSESAVTPLATGSGWIPILPTANILKTVDFISNNTPGSKTIYFWVKDTAGNVSTPVTDSINYQIGTVWTQEAYIKASNVDVTDHFSHALSLNENSLAVGARFEDSNQNWITNGSIASADNTLNDSGAVYIYQRIGNTWEQQAYIKAVNADESDRFGVSVSLSRDTLAVGAYLEDSYQQWITNGPTASENDQYNWHNYGAVYVYERTDTTWAQQAYIKAVNAGTNDYFGIFVSLDGDTLAVGASQEGSNQNFITNGTTASTNNLMYQSGAVYIYQRTGTNWEQQAYIKAANVDVYDRLGWILSLSRNSLAVGNVFEDSNQNFITNGPTASEDNMLLESGAVYIYQRTGTDWGQQAFIKAANANENDRFGNVSLSGETLAVGAVEEDSYENFITNGNTASLNNWVRNSGAVYIYQRTGIAWIQQAYIKAANVGLDDYFGSSVSLNGDILAVGAIYEDSNQNWITNGSTATTNDILSNSGAVYIYQRIGNAWEQQAYIKAQNANADDNFGNVSLSRDTLAVGAWGEDSSQNWITNGSIASRDNSLSSAGAIYIYRLQ